MFKLATKITMALKCAQAAGGVDDHTSPWDYKKDGMDWPNVTVSNNECGSTNQSPIDLPMTVADDKYFKASDDNFQKMYND